MSNQQQTPKAIKIMLWSAQIILSIGFLWGSFLKLFFSVEKLAAMWPWAGQVSVLFLRFTGIIDLLGGIGILLPTVFNLKPKLVPVTAIAIIALMFCASIFHICRGEGSQIGINIFFVVLAGFVFFGRK
ncbi:MAG: DoxX family protein [Flavobacterium sp.]|nr:MAG: DoxX family protein [Flavobacterium sp.]